MRVLAAPVPRTRRPLLSYLSIGVLLLAIALMSFNGVRLGQHLTASDAVLLLGAAALCLAALTREVALLRPPVWLVVAAALLIGSDLLSALADGRPPGDLIDSLRFAAAMVGVIVLVGSVCSGLHLARLVVIAWVLSAAVNSVVGLSDSVGATAIGRAVTGLAFQGRYAALTVHPNHLAMVCAMALPGALWLVLSSRSRVGRVIDGALALTVVLGLIAAGSRAGLLAAAAGVAIVFFSSAKRPLAVAVLLSTIVLASFLALALGFGTQLSGLTIVERATNSQLVLQSDDARRLSYQDAISGFLASPLYGAGFSLVRTAHDIYLQLLQAGGVVALAGFLLFGVRTLRTGLVLLYGRSRANGPWRSLAAAMSASMVVWLVAGLFQNFVYDRFLYLPAGVLLGVAASVASSRRAYGAAD